MMSSSLSRTLDALSERMGYSASSSSSIRHFLENLASGHMEQSLVDDFLKEQEQCPSGLSCACGARLNGFHVDVFWLNEAIRRAQSDDIVTKREGYVASSILLDGWPELSLLLFNALVRDLESSNALHVALALMAASELKPSELNSSLVPMVIKKLNSSTPLVRKRALICLERLWDEPQVGLVLDKLGDPDPSVVAAAVQVLRSCLRSSFTAIEGIESDVARALINFQEQILDSRLGEDTNFKGMCAPWIQVDTLSLLRTIVVEVKDDRLCSEIIDLAVRTMEETNAKQVIGLAVITECLQLMCSVKKVEDEGTCSKFRSSFQYFMRQLFQTKQVHVRHCTLMTLEAFLRSSWRNEVELPVQDLWKHLRHHNRARDVVVLMSSEHNFKQVNHELIRCLEDGGNENHTNNIMKNVFKLMESFGHQDKLWMCSQLLKLMKLSNLSIEDKCDTFGRLKTLLRSDDTIDVRRKLFQGVQDTLRNKKTRSVMPVLIFVYCLPFLNVQCDITVDNYPESFKGTRIEQIINAISDITFDDDQDEELKMILTQEIYFALFALCAFHTEIFDAVKQKELLSKGVKEDHLKMLELKMVSSFESEATFDCKRSDSFASQLDSIVSRAISDTGASSNFYQPARCVRARLEAKKQAIKAQGTTANLSNRQSGADLSVTEQSGNDKKEDFIIKAWSLEGKRDQSNEEMAESNKISEQTENEEQTFEELASVWD